MSNTAEPSGQVGEVIPFPAKPAGPAPAPETVAKAPDVLVGKVIKREGQRQPIVPERWHRKNIRKTLGHHAGLNWHRARFHGLRLPAYLIQALVWAIVGLARLVLAQLAWWWAIEQTWLRSEAIATGDSRQWLTLHKHAREVRLVRGWRCWPSWPVSRWPPAW